VYDKMFDFSSTGLRKVFVRSAHTLFGSIKQNTSKFGKQYRRVTKCAHTFYIAGYRNVVTNNLLGGKM
jgi:hypothetical protein